MKTLKEIKTDFQSFMDSIPSYLNWLKEKFEIQRLEYSLEEMDVVEAFYTKYHKKPEEIGLTKHEIDRICTAYFGTAYLWHFGGEWELETSNSGEFGAFQIVRYGGKGYHWVALPIYNWLFFIETNQRDSPISTIFDRRIKYFKKSSEFKLEPVRNYQ